METFRLAEAGEADEIFALYTEAARAGRENGTSHWNDDYPNREILADDLERGNLFVLEDDGRIIATVTMESVDEAEADGEPAVPPPSWTDCRACELSRLCVSPALQGRHIGERVMRLVSAQARREGYESTRHFASVVNPAARRLYERMGYRFAGESSIYGGLYRAYEMLLG